LCPASRRSAASPAKKPAIQQCRWELGIVRLNSLALLQSAPRRTDTKSDVPQGSRKNSEMSGRGFLLDFLVPQQKIECRDQSKGIACAARTRRVPAGKALAARGHGRAETSSKICWTLRSASSHSARSVSRALVPASNCCRMRCRSASACGPSTDKGVGGTLHVLFGLDARTETGACSGSSR